MVLGIQSWNFEIQAERSYRPCLILQARRNDQAHRPVQRNTAVEQIVGRERRERELIADFQLPIVDLIRATASTQPLYRR